MHTECLWEELKETDYLGDLDADGKVTDNNLAQSGDK
jgi:hypothetical protein